MEHAQDAYDKFAAVRSLAGDGERTEENPDSSLYHDPLVFHKMIYIKLYDAQNISKHGMKSYGNLDMFHPN